METDVFWSAFSQAAATLAGFTLAGFSIYLTSAERAESDDICRHYGLRERSSLASWASIFLILLLFCIPLVLSLIRLMGPILVPAPAISAYFTISLTLLLIFVFISIVLVSIQIRYIERLVYTYAEEEAFQRRRGAIQAQKMNVLIRLLLKVGKRTKAVGLAAIVLLTWIVSYGIYSILSISYGGISSYFRYFLNFPFRCHQYSYLLYPLPWGLHGFISIFTSIALKNFYSPRVTRLPLT